MHAANMTTIADIEAKMMQRLGEQDWVEDYDVTSRERRTLVKRLLVHVFGEDDPHWEDLDAPAVPKNADLRRISSLLKNLQKLRRAMDKTKDVLDPLARSLKDEFPPREDDPLSASLEPLLDELEMVCKVTLHPLRRIRRRGAPQKKAQEGLIRGVAQLVEKILTRQRGNEGKPSKAEVARVAEAVVRLINIRVARKRIQHLI
jgi:hypothetical protein